MRRGDAEGAHNRQQDARRRPYPLVDNNRKWFYIVIIFRVGLIAWVLTWTDIFAEPPDESEGRSAVPGVRWFGDTLRSFGWKAGLWKTVTAGSTGEIDGVRTGATKDPLGVDDLLSPIEGRCFTYRREPQPRHEHGPLTFQWCHGRRATLYRSKGKPSDTRQMPKERDLGKPLEKDFGSPPEFPTVSYFLGGGDLCTASGDGGKGIEAFQAGDCAVDDPDEPQRFGVTVRVWYCAGKDARRSRRDSTSGKTVIVNVREWSAEDGDAAGEEGSTGEQGSGERWPRGRVEGCHYVADVCTTLLKPLYERDCPVPADDSGNQCWHAEPVEGSYAAVPPPMITPRALRGFVDYDRWKPMDNETRLGLLEDVRGMFVHAYDGYMAHAFPAGELRPLSCLPGSLELVKLPLVTLVDTLDTLAIMGNASEFRRAVRLVSERLDVSLDVDVSLFETNIRLLGGLLSAHVFATDPALGLYPASAHPGGDADDGAGSGEEVAASAVEDSRRAGLGRRDSGGDGEGYGGELLALAEDLGRRLLPAFETETGIPYGTVNLKTGVPEGETTESSLAGAGSLALEFSVLSALTNDDRFAKAAEGAVKALFARRSNTLGLVGKHIDSGRGRWTETESGVGPNGDSFYEYLLKMYVLWGDLEYWDMFMQSYASVQRFLREGDWYASAEMSTGLHSRRTFENLMAFWPGMQVLMGDVEQASRTLNAFYLVWRDWGFLPEQLDYQAWALRTSKDSRGYPLRPELIESTLMVHRATGDSSWLWAGRDFMSSLQAACKTRCGYAGIGDVNSRELDDEMPSFFLSETLKYLYLLFDEDNFMHKSEYVFSTEAHPFSISRVRRGGKGTSSVSTPRPASAEKVSAGTPLSSLSSSSSSSCPSQTSVLASPTVACSPAGSTAPSPTNSVCSTISNTLVTSSAPAPDGVDLAATSATTGTTCAPTVTAATTGFVPEDGVEDGVEGGLGGIEYDVGEIRSKGGKLSDASLGQGSTGDSDESIPLEGGYAARTDQSGGASRSAGQAREADQPEQQYTELDEGSPTSLAGARGGTQGLSTGEGTILATWEAGSWAARRVAEGRGYRLGHDRWSDANTLCWIKAAERLRKNDMAISREQYEELLYMRSLWQMYIDRTCPVLPWWSAPYRYDPLNFRDRIQGSGRDVWKSLISVADTLGCNSSIYRNDENGITDLSRLGSLFKNVHSQIFFREDLGTFEVNSKDGNFLVFHRETREVIEVLECSGQAAGEGPGLHVSSYFRPPPVPASSSSYREPQTRSEGERPKAPADGDDGHGETGGEMDLERQAEGEGGENVPEEPLPGEGFGETRDAEDEKSEGLDGKSEGDMRGDMMEDLEGDLEGDLGGGMEVDMEGDMEGDMERGMGGGMQDEADSTLGVGDASPGEEVDKRLDAAKIPESPGSPKAPDVQMASLGFSPSILRLRTIITRKEGLSVYCVVYLVGRENEHGCALATFSPQSHKTPIGPISAELVAATSSDMFGCASGSGADGGGSSSAEGGNGEEGSWDDGDDGAVGARPYTGKIRIVRRGFCTFEEKARVAEEMGAVALIVVNSEPGGRVFPMPGESEHLGEASNISIPVVMVGLADGIEIQEAAAAKANRVEGGDSTAAKAVLEISMHHQVTAGRLLRSEDYVFPGEGRELADATRLSALHLARYGTLPAFPPETRPEWWQSWWPWPRRRSRGETEAGTGAETVKMAEGGKDGDGVLADSFPGILEKLQWLDQSGGIAHSVSDEGEEVYSVEDDLRHPLLAGYTTSAVEGMRPPPFLLPRAFTLDNEVQVMGVGHWGVSVTLLDGERLSLYLVYNVFNPPRRRDEAEDEGLQEAHEVEEATGENADGADDVLDGATCSDDPAP